MQNEVFNFLYLLLIFIVTKLVCSALVISVLITVLAAARKKLPLVLRSWLWGAVFVGLFLPFERCVSIWLAPYNYGTGYSNNNLYNFFLALRSSPFFALSRLVKSYGPYLWLAGFLFFAVKSSIDVHKIRQRLNEGQAAVCAAYFYRGRSHIYLPPNFETSYQPAEQAMLLAHERQHITQHDPFLYRLLPMIQSLFWFCPPVHKAVRLFQQDRELLCDQRVIQIYSQQEYGLLLLREAEKKPIGRYITGIVSETGSVRERIERFVQPIPTSSMIIAVALVVLSVLFGTGLFGLSPVVIEDTMIAIAISIPSHVQSMDMTNPEDQKIFLQTQQLAQYVQVLEDGITIDQEGMYQHALDIGLKKKEQISIHITTGYRPVLLWSGYMHDLKIETTVGELLTEEVHISDDEPLYLMKSFIYRYL